ncbi:hypothetical protein [Alteromonas stellipolaris]|uniref:hypothetical protein n=1 Tax=Alteromonas stellipolaris TaxID=233316 RepID=UPI0026E41C1D|nr:hypothetical protein [Alteromonas stellipolaris]MDO6535827.1 hypothetical protein [Alteromonas stellipolaris]MDO6625825.1 hypothetical protein [Alteromonas stellipolaris]
MSLSTFQRAVLQEMGIPVWVSQSSLQDENTNSVATDVANKRSASDSFATASNYSPAMPSNEEKQSRLAQLRAQVSSDSTKASGQTKATSPKASDSSSATPRSVDSAEDSNVDSTASKSASQVESVNASSQLSSHSSNVLSNPASNNTPALVELTQAQRLQGKQWLQDLDVALAYLQLSFTSTQVKIGQDVAVTNGGIVLPSAPHLLTAAMQRQLWKMLCALSNNVS